MASPSAPSMDSSEGVLVISVWHETHGEEPFRGRLSAVNASGDRREIGAVTNHARALALVEEWLTSLRPPATTE